MSATKRSRGRQPEISPQQSQAAKRLKTATSTHVPSTNPGLSFLVDENVRAGRKLEAKLTNGLPANNASRVDESHAVVAQPTNNGAVNGVLSDADDASDGSDEEDQEIEDSDDDEESDADRADIKLNGDLDRNGEVAAAPQDVDMAGNDDADDAGEEPTFGDMLQARHPEPIDVQAAFANPFTDSSALVPASGGKALQAPSGTSLGTVLTQALKTNDRDLLESCLQSSDVPTIRSTIQRLQSQHVSTLLQRIAERIYKRPGRTGPLMVWIQWSLVAHGGYLATQPDVMDKLRSLHRVVQERASGLRTLLHLKGKLDMLSAQLELRRSMQAASRAADAEDDDEDEGVIYVDGQEENFSDDDIPPPVYGNKKQARKPLSRKERRHMAASGLPIPETLPNGYGHDLSESDESDVEDADGLLDVEAEEVSDDDEDEDDDEEDGAEGDSDEEASSAPESDDEDDGAQSDNVSEASIEEPKLKNLNRKR